MSNPTILAALEAQKPAIAASYAAQVRYTFDRMVERHGASLRGISNCWTFAKTWREWISRFVAFSGPQGARVAELQADRVEVEAAQYADLAAVEWLAKIEAKMGQVEGAEVAHLTGVAFQISGTWQGRRVAIAQQMIVNYSRTGRPYNQFPARLAIDGKATSEAAWRKLRA